MQRCTPGVYATAVRSLPVIAIMLAAASARADRASDAQQIARDAQALAQQGDFLGAAARFKQALALDAKPEYECNVGIAYWKARDLPRAQLYLATCSTGASHLGEAFVAQVRDVLDEVEKLLRAGDFAPVEVRVFPEGAVVGVSTFAPDDSFVGSRIVWLPFGEHDLSATAPGHDPGSVHVTITDRTPRDAHLALDETPAPPPEIQLIPTPAPAMVHAARWPMYVAGGATALLVVGDVILYRNAADDAYTAGTPNVDYEHWASRARARRDILYVSYGITAAAALATGFFWWHSRAHVAPVVSVAHDEMALSIAGSW